MIDNKEAITLVDQTIKQISNQQFVPTSEMTDLLLDIRLYLLTVQEESISQEV